MACPRCGCKTTYPHYIDDDIFDTDYESCAHCGAVYDIELSLLEDDDDEIFLAASDGHG